MLLVLAVAATVARVNTLTLMYTCDRSNINTLRRDRNDGPVRRVRAGLRYVRLWDDGRLRRLRGLWNDGWRLWPGVLLMISVLTRTYVFVSVAYIFSQPASHQPVTRDMHYIYL